MTSEREMSYDGEMTLSDKRVMKTSFRSWRQKHDVGYVSCKPASQRLNGLKIIVTQRIISLHTTKLPTANS